MTVTILACNEMQPLHTEPRRIRYGEYVGLRAEESSRTGGKDGNDNRRIGPESQRAREIKSNLCQAK